MELVVNVRASLSSEVCKPDWISKHAPKRNSPFPSGCETTIQILKNEQV